MLVFVRPVLSGMPHTPKYDPQLVWGRQNEGGGNKWREFSGVTAEF